MILLHWEKSFTQYFVEDIIVRASTKIFIDLKKNLFATDKFYLSVYIFFYYFNLINNIEWYLIK